MAAAKGNKYAEGNKGGRPLAISTPEDLWQLACNYFEWCDNNPWMKNEAMKSGELAGKIIQVPTARPYTIKGFAIYLGVNSTYFQQFNTDKNQEFSNILTRIYERIQNQKFEGAAVGAFNANIIARDLGLSETVKVENIDEFKSTHSNLLRPENDPL